MHGQGMRATRPPAHQLAGCFDLRAGQPRRRRRHIAFSAASLCQPRLTMNCKRLTLGSSDAWSRNAWLLRPWMHPQGGALGL